MFSIKLVAFVCAALLASYQWNVMGAAAALIRDNKGVGGAWQPSSLAGRGGGEH